MLLRHTTGRMLQLLLHRSQELIWHLCSDLAPPSISHRDTIGASKSERHGDVMMTSPLPRPTGIQLLATISVLWFITQHHSSSPLVGSPHPIITIDDWTRPSHKGGSVWVVSRILSGTLALLNPTRTEWGVPGLLLLLGTETTGGGGERPTDHLPHEGILLSHRNYRWILQIGLRSLAAIPHNTVLLFSLFFTSCVLLK